MSFPYPRHRGIAHPLGLGHGPCAPVGCIGGHAVQCGFYNRSYLLPIKPLGTWTFWGILGQARRALLLEPFSPKQDRRPGSVHLVGYGCIRKPVTSQKTNPRSKNNPLSGSLGTHPGFQPASLFRIHQQGGCCVFHAVVLTRTVITCKAIIVTEH